VGSGRGGGRWACLNNRNGDELRIQNQTYSLRLENVKNIGQPSVVGKNAVGVLGRPDDKPK